MGALDYPDECSLFADEETEAWGHSRSGWQCSLLMATLGPQEHFLGLQPVRGDVGLTDVLREARVLAEKAAPVLSALGLGCWGLGKGPLSFAERRGLGQVCGPSRPQVA